jgi:malate/lactate dehydrogenase
MTRLCVMGAGRIGGEVAFLAVATGLVDELVIHDAVAPFLHAQVLDLQHTGLDVMITTDLREASSADLGVFAAGYPGTRTSGPGLTCSPRTCRARAFAISRSRTPRTWRRRSSFA